MAEGSSSRGGPGPAPDTPAIELVAAGKTYSPGTEAEVRAMRDVDLVIRHGEFVAIVGPSGSGKSTLMNVIGCLDAPSEGTARVNGVDVATLDAAGRARLRLGAIGFVFQSFQLLPRMSALENVMMPLAYAGVPRNQRRDRAMAALERVDLAARAAHRPSELSGGQQQRVAIARALINEPAIVLADEPTGALDTKTGADVLALFADLNAHGRTIVLITHDHGVAARAARVCTMIDGRLHEGAIMESAA